MRMDTSTYHLQPFFFFFKGKSLHEVPQTLLSHRLKENNWAAESFPPCIFTGQEKEKANLIAAQTRLSESYCFL